jgi:hypothetical protein
MCGLFFIHAFKFEMKLSVDLFFISDMLIMPSASSLVYSQESNMAEIKTKVRKTSVDKFLQGIRDEEKREECHQVVKMMKKATKAEPKMWGADIVGFGDCHYAYKSGREIDWFITGFSPRVQSLTLYITGGLDKALLKKLGKCRTGKNCLYINKLEDIDKKVLSDLIVKSVKKSKVDSK